MIRAGSRWAVAVRRPDGTIATHRDTVPGWATRFRNIPVIRGAIALVASVTLGMRALSWSRTVADDDGSPPPSKAAVVLATVASIAILVVAFAVLPALGARAVTSGSGAVFAAVEGLLRMGMLVGYVAAIGRRPVIRRTFEYHGAEHQAVAAFEAGAPLEGEIVGAFSPRHARCGTDFLVLVAMVAVVAFTVVSPEAWWALLASRILMFPFVAGVSYEVLKLSDRKAARRWVGPLLAPGLAVQRLTTRPSTDGQVEVAIAAVQAALAEEPVPSAAP